jgi:ABC-type Fe3+/spermidine/putrescine transport system ATPase subunit
LLDEPLAALDRSLRDRLLTDLSAVLRSTRTTALFVTHDQAEAFAFSDTVVLMRAGHVVEAGAPERLYREPESAFTAQFIGAANLVPARVERPADRVLVGGESVEAGSWSAAAAAARGSAMGAEGPEGCRKRHKQAL